MFVANSLPFIPCTETPPPSSLPSRPRTSSPSTTTPQPRPRTSSSPCTTTLPRPRTPPCTTSPPRPRTPTWTLTPSHSPPPRTPTPPRSPSTPSRTLTSPPHTSASTNIGALLSTLILQTCLSPPPPPAPELPSTLHQSMPDGESSSSSSDFIIDPMPKIPVKKRRCRRTKGNTGGVCEHIFKKGGKKGERCDKLCRKDSTLCSLHSVTKQKLVTPPLVIPKKTYYKTRINRLKVSEQYRLIEITKNPRVVIVKNKDTYFKVKIPNAMSIPTGKGYYLVRQPLGKITVWKQL